MSKRKKQPPSVPSKAYLVSFGDTMTALLAFFIVLNSLAKEQTGANMHSGTGSFVNAFSSSGQPGHLSGSRSNEVIQQESQKPIYALAENMKDDSDKNIGPDEINEQQRVLDREKEQFQKFLTELESQLDLDMLPEIENQVVFDSFERPDPTTGKLSLHAVQLISEAVTKLREPGMTLEIVLWADMPRGSALKRKLDKSVELRKEIERTVWMKASQKSRIRYRVKPWLFADAKRPYLSVILGRTSAAPDAG
ncbi:flagellar motor protein MotD [Stieleria maiorica]|uniref:Flagellar motor protein MotD n=1 Tax=Stieleria maiorica TaxID=2795974 RepID=A0A5B9MC94_9BACT|nr:flagellar motor protein MotB [Stieleria maiorica]QEF97640.1 flagellar motor protein MotD [Stieleria maiorica]